MYEYSITFVHCQLYILLLIKCTFFPFFLFVTSRDEIKILIAMSPVAIVTVMVVVVVIITVVLVLIVAFCK